MNSYFEINTSLDPLRSVQFVQFSSNTCLPHCAGVVTHSSGKKIFAMEVDGFGNFFFGDDANVYVIFHSQYYYIVFYVECGIMFCYITLYNTSIYISSPISVYMR